VIVQPVVATVRSQIVNRVKAPTVLAAKGLSAIVLIVAVNPLVTASRVMVAIAQSVLAVNGPSVIVQTGVPKPLATGPRVQKDHLATVRLAAANAASAPMVTESPVRRQIVRAQSVHSATSPAAQSRLAISHAKAGRLVANPVASLVSQHSESRVASVPKAGFRARDRAVAKVRIAMDPGAKAQVVNLLEARE